MNHARSIPMLALALSTAAFAQPPSYGIDFVTIGDAGNVPCALPDPGGISYATGRGGVPYEYRIGRLEITTIQWLQFVNTFSTQGGSWTNFGRPAHWGAQIDLSYIGPGERYELKPVANAGLLPVGGISWRTAAMYCNWLHNGQSAQTSSLQSGAYDASTFTTNANGTFNDQLAHDPGARFWIPTLDEWIKAAHYDPNRYGSGQGGWWMYPHGSDTPLAYGPPGTGQANAGFTQTMAAHWNIPLGSYASILSPWGLQDAAGAATEWTEEAFSAGLGPSERGIEGSASGWPTSLSSLNDRATRLGSAAPDFRAFEGLRIASTVPSPHYALPLGIMWFARRRRV